MKQHLQDGANNDQSAQSGSAHAPRRVRYVVEHAADKKGHARPQHERWRGPSHALPLPAREKRWACKH